MNSYYFFYCSLYLLILNIHLNYIHAPFFSYIGWKIIFICIAKIYKHCKISLRYFFLLKKNGFYLNQMRWWSFHFFFHCLFYKTILFVSYHIHVHDSMLLIVSCMFYKSVFIHFKTFYEHAFFDFFIIEFILIWVHPIQLFYNFNCLRCLIIP